MGCWLMYHKGSFQLKEFHHSFSSAQGRANTLDGKVRYMKLLDESRVPPNQVRELVAGSIEVDAATNRLIL